MFCYDVLGRFLYKQFGLMAIIYGLDMNAVSDVHVVWDTNAILLLLLLLQELVVK